MAFCAHCGVEVEPGHATCPLCLRPLAPETAPLPASQAFARQLERVPTPMDRQRRALGLAVAVLSALLGIALLVCLLVDLLYDGGGWSRFAAAALVLAWWLGFTPRLFLGKPLVYGLTDAGLVWLFLLVIDYFVGWSGWSLAIGLPIMVAVALTITMGWLAWRLYARKAGFVLATLLGCLSVLLLAIDASVHLFFNAAFRFGWSLITLAVLIPLVLLGVVLQLVFFRSARFRRYFHL